MVHENSFEARKALIKSMKKKTRAQMIFEKLYYFGPLSDRQLLKLLFPNRDDMNLVRPRLSDMLKEGAIEEVGSVTEYGATVRTTHVKFPVEVKEQTELFT